MPKVKTKHISTKCPFARPSTCPICLQKVKRRSFLESCRHEFCFVCLAEWSEMSDKCPVCRTKNTKIIYDKRSETQFKTRAVMPRVEENLQEDMAAFCRQVQQHLSEFRSIHETNIRKFKTILAKALAGTNMEVLEDQLDRSMEEFKRISCEMPADPQNNNNSSSNYDLFDDGVFFNNQRLTDDDVASPTAGNSNRPGPISEIRNQTRELIALFQSSKGKIQAILESRLNEENVEVFWNIVQPALQKFLNLYGNFERLDKELGNPVSQENMQKILCLFHKSVIILDVSAYNDSNSAGHINIYPRSFKKALTLEFDIEFDLESDDDDDDDDDDDY